LAEGEFEVFHGFAILDLRFAIWATAAKARLPKNESELKNRTKQFALRVIKLVGALPKSTEGRALGSQLVRSGTSVGANYRAACRGRSKAEFIAKLGTVEEEADESAYWLELIIDGGLMSKRRVDALWQEACELTAIMAASRISASGRR
jgi:four helix bundle protein